MRIDEPQLARLIDVRGHPCVSFYCPIERRTDALEENRAALAHQFEEAMRGLCEHTRPPIRQRLRALFEDERVFDAQCFGWSVFVSAEFTETHPLSFQPEPLVVVGERLHLTPIFREVDEPRRFYALVLESDGARLVESDRGAIREPDLSHYFPRSLHDLAGSSHERRLRRHARAAHPEGDSDASSTGDSLRRYLRSVDLGLRAVTDDDPVVLVGEEAMTRAFRDVSYYEHPLLEAEVSFAARTMGASDIARAIRPLVRSAYVERRDAAARRARAHENTPRVADELDAVLRAADEGRVASLFVCRTRHRWREGSIDVGAPDGGSLATREDLLSIASARAFSGGADVFVVDPEALPSRSGAIVALLRDGCDRDA